MQKDRRETLIAIGLFMLVLLTNSVMFAIVSYISAPGHGGYSAFQLMLCYGLIGLMLMLPWAVRQGARGLKTTRVKLYSLRALLEYGSFTLSFYALSFVGDDFTLPMHSALNFIQPLLATVVTIAVLKEKSHTHTWLAVAAGFIGVLIITRPGFIPTSHGVFFVLMAAFGFSFCGVVIKLLTRTELPLRIAFYMLALTALLALPAGITHWKTPDAAGWGWFALIGVIACLQQVMVAKAIARVPLLVLIPLHFTQLIFATILSYAIYAKVVDEETIIGALVILAATLYNSFKNMQEATTIRHEQ